MKLAQTLAGVATDNEPTIPAARKTEIHQNKCNAACNLVADVAAAAREIISYLIVEMFSASSDLVM